MAGSLTEPVCPYCEKRGDKAGGEYGFNCLECAARWFLTLPPDFRTWANVRNRAEKYRLNESELAKRIKELKGV